MKKNDLFLEEILRTLELLYGEEKKTIVFENKVKKEILLEGSIPISPKDLIKKAVIEFLEKAETIVPKAVSEKNPSVLERDFSSASPGFKFNGKSTVDEILIDEIKTARIAAGADDIPFDQLSGQSRKVIVDWISKDRRLMDEIYETLIVNSDALAKSDMSEKSLMVKIRDQAEAQRISIREYLKKHFTGLDDVSIDLILPRIEKNIETINTNPRAYIESIPWATIKSKKRSEFEAWYIKSMFNFVQYWVKRNLPTFIDGKFHWPEKFMKQQTLINRLNDQLAKIKYDVEHGRVEESVGAWRQLAYTAMSLSTWSGEKIMPAFERYVINNKYISEEDLNVIKSKDWYKKIVEEAKIETNNYYLPLFWDSIVTQIKGHANLAMLGLPSLISAFKRSYKKEATTLHKELLVELEQFASFIVITNGRKTASQMASNFKIGSLSGIIGLAAEYIVLTFVILPRLKAMLSTALYNQGVVNNINSRINQLKALCEETNAEGCDEMLDAYKLEKTNWEIYDSFKSVYQDDAFFSAQKFWELLNDEQKGGILAALKYTGGKLTHLDEFYTVIKSITCFIMFQSPDDLYAMIADIQEKSDKISEQLKHDTGGITGVDLNRAMNTDEALNALEIYFNSPEAIGITKDVADKNTCIYDKEKQSTIRKNKEGKILDKDDNVLIVGDDNILYYEDEKNIGKPNKNRKYCSGAEIVKNNVTVSELKSIAPCFWDGIKDADGNKIMVNQTQDIKITPELKTAIIPLNFYNSAGELMDVKYSRPYVLNYDDESKTWKFVDPLIKGNFDCDDSTELIIGGSSNLTPQSVKSQFSGYWTVVDVSQGVDGVEVINNNEFKIWFNGGTLNGNQYPKGVFTIRKQNNKWYYVSKKTGEITDTEFTPFN